MSNENKVKRPRFTDTEIEAIIQLSQLGFSSREICRKLFWSTTRKSSVNYVLARNKEAIQEGVYRDCVMNLFDNDFSERDCPDGDFSERDCPDGDFSERDCPDNEVDNDCLNNESEPCYGEKYTPPKQDGAKILIFDIETSPVLANVWGLFNNDCIGLNQVKNDWYILSYAAKWLGSSEEKIFYRDLRGKVFYEDDSDILMEMWDLLDEADIVVSHNGDRFDLKKLNARFILNGFIPPASYKSVDTLKLARSKFAFTSNKLAYLTDKLCTKYKKLDHGNFAGFNLWRGMLDDDIEAWKECEVYNKYDVLSLEELYLKLVPWSSNHPNLNLYKDAIRSNCNVCGEGNLIKYGYSYTPSGKYQQFRCSECGGLSRGKENLLSKDKKKTLRNKI